MTRRRLLAGAALLAAVVFVPAGVVPAGAMPLDLSTAPAEAIAMLRAAPMSAEAASLEASWLAPSAMGVGTGAIASGGRAAGVALLMRSPLGWTPYVFAAGVLVGLIPEIVSWAKSTDRTTHPLNPTPNTWVTKSGPFEVSSWYDGAGNKYLHGRLSVLGGSPAEEYHAAVQTRWPYYYGEGSCGSNSGNPHASSPLAWDPAGTFSLGNYEITNPDGGGPDCGAPKVFKDVTLDVTYDHAVDNSSGPAGAGSKDLTNKDIVDALEKLITATDDHAAGLRDAIDMAIRTSTKQASPYTPPAGQPVFHQRPDGTIAAGAPDGSDEGIGDELPDGEPSPSPGASASPSPGASASPSAGPSGEPSLDPGNLPQYDEPNFVIHFWEAIQTKFPLDFFASMGSYSDPPWEFEILGYTFDLSPMQPWFNVIFAIATVGICWGLVVSI